MKFIKLFRFDLIYGVVKEYKKYLIYVLLVGITFFELYANLCAFRLREFSYGDVLMFIFHGAKEYVSTSTESFIIPFSWFLNHLLILYFTLNYMNKDLEGFGQQIIYRSKSRSVWWISKCITQITAVSVYYVLIWLVILALTLCFNGELSLEISGFMKHFIDVGENISSDEWLLSWELFVMPWLCSLAMSVMQMTLCLFVRPVMSFIISVIICIASSYKMSGFLLANYSMLVRSDKVIWNGLHMETGVIVLVLITLASIFVGLLKFKRQNILSKG